MPGLHMQGSSELMQTLLISGLRAFYALYLRARVEEESKEICKVRKMEGMRKQPYSQSLIVT